MRPASSASPSHRNPPPGMTRGVFIGRSGDRPRRQGGFSYLEILVAMVIVSVLALVAFDWLSSAVTQIGRSSVHSAAAGWALGEVEYLRRQCYERLQPGNRHMTPASLRQGEPPLPSTLGAADVLLEADGPARLRATVAVYRATAAGSGMVGPPVLETTTFIGDLRTPGQCP